MLIDIIREAAMGCVEEQAAGLLFGRVRTTEPLCIEVENRLTLDETRLILPLELKPREIEATFAGESKMLPVARGLLPGDRAALVRLGEYYLVAGRVAG